MADIHIVRGNLETLSPPALPALVAGTTGSKSAQRWARAKGLS